MIDFINKCTENILALPRYSKRTIAILTDIGLCFFCTWLAFIIRLEEILLFKDLNYFSALISLIIAIPIFYLFGLYRTIFRFAGLSIVFTVLMSILLYGLLYFIVIGVFGIEGVPRSVGVIQPLLLFFAIMSSRLGFNYIFSGNYTFKKYFNKKNILVYGAGVSGRRLVVLLENNPEFKVVGFLDDNHQLHRQVILGQTVFSQLDLEKLIHTKNISMVLLAMPSIRRAKRNQIVERLSQYTVSVKTLPSISEIVDGRITISDIKDLNTADLLSRHEVKADTELLNKNVYSKTVLVTGAGGSIGSELCRQIIILKPKKLVLIELSEYALYIIYEELKKINKGIKIIPILTNAQYQKKLERIFDTFKVDTVYHAAAYKHVSLVEENICEGVKNNVFSTLAVANASVIKKVSNLVLISSDKAVRPTNIMGASKRLSELCVQGIYNDIKNIKTNFSIVRFGNVLESSGSAIPKFKKQISEGGPVTLSHKNVTRYFMTLNEAAQLVIQAGAMGKNAEVFVLDMGKSIKISDLIYKMIRLSGYTPKDSKNPTGDIEVKITGLRTGEKLYEELLIGDNPKPTFHKKIKKAQDHFIPFHELRIDLDDLSSLLEDNNIVEVIAKLTKLVPLYQPSSKIVDFLYQEKLNTKNSFKKFTIVKDLKYNVINIKNK